MASYSGNWPAGTTVSASSYHAANYANQCYCNRTYEPSLVIDGDPSTFWNDDTSYTWPDAISVTVPMGSEMDLSGLSIVSSEDGYIVDFDVHLLVDGSWITTNRLRGISKVQTDLTFAGAEGVTVDGGVVKGVSGISISVLNSEDEFSRIAEIKPVLGSWASKSSTSTTATKTSTSTSTTADASTSARTSTTTPTASITGGAATSATSSPATANVSYYSQHKGVIIGVSVAGAFILFSLLAAILWLWIRKRRSARKEPMTVAPASVYDFKPELYYKGNDTTDLPPSSPVSPQVPMPAHTPWSSPPFSPDAVGQRSTYAPFRRSMHELESR